MTKLLSLAIISLLSMSLFAVFADAMYSGNSKTYISSAEMRANMMEKTQQHLDYVRNKLLDSSKPKTKVYRTLGSINVIPGESAKTRMGRTMMTSSMYRASVVAEANSKKAFEDKSASETPEYLSHAQMSRLAAQNSVKAREMAQLQYHKKFRMGASAGY